MSKHPTDNGLAFASAINYCFNSEWASKKELSQNKFQTSFSCRKEPADDTVLMWREQDKQVPTDLVQKTLNQ
jgi:hypothetical protein